MSVVCCPTDKLAAAGVEYAVKGSFTAHYTVSGPNPAKRSVLFIPDIFGFHPHSVRFADELAARGNFKVYFPDFFNGKPWPGDKIPGRDEAWPAFIKDATAPDMLARIAGAAAQLKAQDGVEPCVIGFCWGAAMALQLGSVAGRVACVAMPHPSFVNVPEAEACTVPCGLYPSRDDTAMDAVKAKLSEKGLLKNYIYCDDVHHGFAGARHDATSEACVKRVDEVMCAVIELFKSCA